MATIRISYEDLAADLERRAIAIPKAIKGGMISAMHRGRGKLVAGTPVDRGLMKSAWEVFTATMEIANEAPHAGIIEGGARPHKVNREGREAIQRWAMRQLGADEQAAKAITYAIVQKLGKFGQKGKFIALKLLPELNKITKEEVEYRLKKLAGSRV